MVIPPSAERPAPVVGGNDPCSQSLVTLVECLTTDPTIVPMLPQVTDTVLPWNPHICGNHREFAAFIVDFPEFLDYASRQSLL